MNKNIKWAIIFTCVCLACALLFVLHGRNGDGKFAVISQDGKVIQTIDLSKVEKPYDVRISGKDNSYNTITVCKDKIAVTESDCPDKICVHQGYIKDGRLPIVCLPHELTVTIKTQAEIDAVAGGN